MHQAHSSVYVLDQDRARAFYTEKLGFEVRDDVTMGNFRWLTVAPKTQPDACIILMPLKAGPMMDDDAAASLRELLAKGVLGGGVLATDDCKRTHAELAARGVEFIREPKEMPYGVEALFRDDSGNFYSLTERQGRDGENQRGGMIYCKAPDGYLVEVSYPRLRST